MPDKPTAEERLKEIGKLAEGNPIREFQVRLMSTMGFFSLFIIPSLAIAELFYGLYRVIKRNI